MVKKVLIGGIFLFGGYYIIKKLLPTNTSSEYDLDLKEYQVKESFATRPQPTLIDTEIIRNKSITDADVGNRQNYGGINYGYGTDQDKEWEPTRLTII